MTYKFRAEIKRIDKSSKYSVADGIIAKAVELDNSLNKYRNQDLWYLYLDDVFELEDSLSSCLEFLYCSYDYFMPLETSHFQRASQDKNVDIDLDSLSPEQYMQYTEQYFYTNLVTDCYKKGTFQGKRFTIEHNSISSYFK